MSRLRLRMVNNFLWEIIVRVERMARLSALASAARSFGRAGCAFFARRYADTSAAISRNDRARSLTRPAVSDNSIGGDFCAESLLEPAPQVSRCHSNSLKDGAQCSRFYRLRAVNRHNCAQQHIRGMAENDVRSVLALDDKTGFLERVDQAGAGNLWQNAQAVTSISVKVTRVTGMDNPSSRRLSKYPSIASRILANASSLVSPWLAHPGRLGTNTEYPPSGSDSRTTVNFLMVITFLSLLDGEQSVKAAQ